MLEINCWYKVMDSGDKKTEVFATGCIFKVMRSNNYVTDIYSPLKNRRYPIFSKTIADIRVIKLDSKALDILYSKEK